MIVSVAKTLTFKLYGKPKKLLTNKIFGYLTIGKLLGRVEEYKSNVLYYEAMCSCGRSMVVSSYDLLQGDTTSCGCRKFELAHDNLTGIQFGRLTAISINMTKKNASQNIYWNCECSCGTMHVVSSSALKNKLVSSCGCLLTELQQSNFNKLKDYGSIGYLQIISLEANGKIKCLCTGCNSIIYRRASSLIRKELKSCGCKASELKSLSSGGTGTSGECISLKRLLREYISDKWAKKLRTFCCITGDKAEDVHHLNAYNNIIKGFHLTTSKTYLLLPIEQQELIKAKLVDISNGLPLTKELHRQLHKELGKCPTKEQSLNWINNKRKEIGLHELYWNIDQRKYI